MCSVRFIVLFKTSLEHTMLQTFFNQLPRFLALCTAAAALALGASTTVLAQADGLVSVASPRSATDTMNRLETMVKERGLNVFARIDQAAGAAKIGKTLRSTELLIFGNPQGGTPLMECTQTAGIDLPLKALVWTDEAGKVMLSYNDPAYLAKRHGAASCPAVENLTKALNSIAQATIAP
jgi:uncharacterized protein (DUF302 family)